MPNTSQAKKAVRVQERRRQRNVTVRSAVKTTYKTALSKLTGSVDEAQKAAVIAISQLDKALAKGLIHKNKAARKKARLMKKIHLLTQK